VEAGSPPRWGGVDEEGEGEEGTGRWAGRLCATYAMGGGDMTRRQTREKEGDGEREQGLGRGWRRGVRGRGT
jgi:hypothetical protein